MKNLCVTLAAFAFAIFVFQPMSAQPAAPTLEALAVAGHVKIDSTGTGETIGHVANLKIQNLTDQRINCVVPSMVLESVSRKNQDYVCPKAQTVKIEPHGTATVPMDGVCINRNKPPVGKGAPGDLLVNEGNPTISQNPNSHIPVKQARDLLRICTSKYDAAKKLQEDGALKNLPYKDKQKQRDIVVQWSTWCDPRISEITGAPSATKDDLRKVVYKQVEEQGSMTPEKKKKVDQGIDTIFDKVELTTAKAKDLEKPEKEIPAVAGTTVAETPLGGQPVSAPTGAPGETVAGTPTATPQGLGTTPTQPTATPTPCKEDPLRPLKTASDLVEKAVKACQNTAEMDAILAEQAAERDDLRNPEAKAASDKADKAAADAKATLDTAEADAKTAKEKAAKTNKSADRQEAKKKAEDAKAKAVDAVAADKAAEAAKSPLRKKADAARAAADTAKKTRDDALKAAQDAISHLKCPENKKELNKKLEDACP